MFNKINNLNENGSQLELIAKKGKYNMTNKTEKTIHLFGVDEIIELSNELIKRGETLQSIEYKDNCKFDKGSLFLRGSLSKIKSFQVSIKESDKTIERMYKPIDDDNPYFIDDFKISFENIYYRD